MERKKVSPATVINAEENKVYAKSLKKTYKTHFSDLLKFKSFITANILK